MYLGTAASPGIAIGPAVLVQSTELTIIRKNSDNSNIEIESLHRAIAASRTDLERIRDKAHQAMGAEKAAIFEAHLMMLEDPVMIDEVKELITVRKASAEAAYDEISQRYVKTFEAMTNAYMKERAADVRDVSVRVLRKLLGVETVDLTSLEADCVLVGHDFTPSDTATMNRARVLGILTDIGGRTSHTAIMARTLGIPAVVGAKVMSHTIRNGDLVIIDGDSGEIHINPEAGLIARYSTQKQQHAALKDALNQLRGKPSVTRDGRQVELAGNIGSPKDIEVLKKGDAEGVGLFRTEFIYMNRETLPSEEEQFECYREVLSSVSSKPVIIRTLDIGGDKSLPYLDMPKEMNPFLGYRAIRICLDQVDLFKTQLRAMLRASVYGNLNIMFPMISSLEELLAAKRILAETASELRTKGVKIAQKIPVGIMIEIPSAAMMADVLAKNCDFFSIGTNDLIQYTCAVDRMNEKIHDLYNSYHPGVLRLVNKVIQDAHSAGIWAGMCGEVAGELPLVPVLLGMGLDEFSMSPNSILK
ncbi:MAG: phosphoenolpyruvate--protein phosphotransferase, partial [Bdellovibrionales bacterium]|nr:phosphoenolpyruvate--protein phosphotransferase [Bdellovibrionales bacterium]